MYHSFCWTKAFFLLLEWSKTPWTSNFKYFIYLLLILLPSFLNAPFSFFIFFFPVLVLFLFALFLLQRATGYRWRLRFLWMKASTSCARGFTRSSAYSLTSRGCRLIRAVCLVRCRSFGNYFLKSHKYMHTTHAHIYQKQLRTCSSAYGSTSCGCRLIRAVWLARCLSDGMHFSRVHKGTLNGLSYGDMIIIHNGARVNPTGTYRCCMD